MTGRARGRSRGRGRTTEAPSSGEARRPGEPAVRPPEQAQVGRGRSRGPQADAVAQQRPPVQQMQQTPSPPTEQMRQMTVGDTGGSSAPAPRSNRYSERVLREPGKDIRGTSGKPINIMTNSFALETSPDFMIYQYQVTFNPEIDFKKARIGLVNAQTDLIGNIKAFDGQILFLPRKLPNTETRIQAIRNRKNSPPEPVEIIFKLTNELPKESPSLMQVFNIIFRRYAIFSTKQ